MNCEVCGQEVQVMIFKNDRVCSELCRKLRAGEQTGEQALVSAPAIEPKKK